MPGVWAPGLTRVGPGRLRRGARRGQPDPERQRGRGGGRAPGPPARRTPPPQLAAAAASSEEPVRVGGRRGAGLACGAAVLHDSVVFGEGLAGLS